MAQIDHIGPSGIKRNSAHANRFKKQEKHRRNMELRSALYSDMGKEIPTGKVGEWHTTLFALSAGTAT